MRLSVCVCVCVCVCVRGYTLPLECISIRANTLLIKFMSRSLRGITLLYNVITELPDFLFRIIELHAFVTTNPQTISGKCFVVFRTSSKCNSETRVVVEKRTVHFQRSRFCVSFKSAVKSSDRLKRS